MCWKEPRNIDVSGLLSVHLSVAGVVPADRDGDFLGECAEDAVELGDAIALGDRTTESETVANVPHLGLDRTQVDRLADRANDLRAVPSGMTLGATRFEVLVALRRRAGEVVGNPSHGCCSSRVAT